MEPKHLNFSKMAGIAILAFGSNLALAETVSVPASVTVNNAIDFTFTGTLNFGEVRATADVTTVECTGLILGANPATTITADAVALTCTAGADTSAIQAIGGTVERPEFTIAGIAPFTTLDLTLPAGATSLTAATAPPGSPEFQVVDVTAYKTSGTPAAITTTIQTDASGGATFVVGGSLVTDPGTPTSANYENLDYTGTFDVTVAYP